MSTIKALLILLFLLTHSAQSKQIHFSKVEKGDLYQFNYQWLDQYKQNHAISFSLEKSALFNKFRNFQVYKPELAAQYISKNIVKYFQKNPIKNVQVNYVAHTKSIELKGQDLTLIHQAQEKILELQGEFTNKHLKEHWYHTFTTHNQQAAIKPDHTTFALLSVEDLTRIKPLISEKISIQNIRKATNYVLSFVQNIPYSTLNSRTDSSGSGFNPPLKLLWENQGDCDSKVTLTAAILRSIMPHVKMVLVFIDNHALIGINTLAKQGEKTIMFKGINYVLGEPTGPALLLLGTLDAVSELAIDQGQYTAEAFH